MTPYPTFTIISTLPFPSSPVPFSNLQSSSLSMSFIFNYTYLPTTPPTTTPLLSSSLTMNIISIQAQLVRAWQAICQVAGLIPSLSHCLFFPSFFSVFISHLSFSLSVT